MGVFLKWDPRGRAAFFSVASPTTAKGQRSRSQSCWKTSRRGGDGEDVAFLGLVAPDLERRHAGLVVGDGAELEAAAAAAVVDEFGQGVGDAAGADVVDEGDGVVVAERPAAVDDLLAAALHLGVVALDAGEIEVLVLPEPLAMELAAPPPRPMSMAGPPRTMSWSPGLIAPFLTWSARMLPRPPASMMGLW
jgi:hypothetical protein